MSAAGASSDMGSEHYCLRWNNHQSNLLGVFSQLLHDESLVDVTLACSEGVSIRAHKVVLSACSSYFQSLFVDHPSRHPIVILKDVRFAELRTLVDFMYKGEVNVEYCHLSGLLKTAESLKVKGLAEMTTLSATSASASASSSGTPVTSQPSTNTARTVEMSTTAGVERMERLERMEHMERVERMEVEQETPQDLAPAARLPTAPHSPSPLRSEPLQHVRRTRREPPEPCSPGSPPTPPSPPSRTSPIPEHRIHPNEANNHNKGINMSMNSNNSSSGALGPGCSSSGVELRLAPLSSLTPHPHAHAHAHAAQLTHTHGTPTHLILAQAPHSPREEREPIAGPSGLLPVQEEPLSLKKEIEWDRLPDDKSGGESSSDYRMPHEMMYAEAAGAGGGSLALWSPLLALHACRLRRYLSDDCLSGYGERRRCDLCLAAFPSAWLLERHAALQHSALPAPTTHPHLSHSHVACSLADRDDKPFVCEQCGQSYRYRSAYAKHREQNHRARLPADKLFTCDVCGMQFRYLKSFKKHRLNHALERLHTKTSASASSGGAGAVSSSNEASGGEAEPEQDDTVDSYGAPLDVDSESAPSEERRACERAAPSAISVADSSDSEATRLHGGAVAFSAAESERQRERERERRFACPFCGKCVRSKENLKLHVRKHTGERPFVCLFCGRAFGGKSDLTRHLRIHTGERPYHCEACGKCFARADYLSKHLTTHVHNAR